MTYKKQCSAIFLQRFFESILCIGVQMIGRLIQQKNVGLPVDDFAETHLRLLTSAQNTNLTFNMLCSKPAFCKCRTYFILVKGWEFLPDFFDTGCLILIIAFLFKVSGQNIFAGLAFPG